MYGLTIFYPEQTCPNPPVEYPWTVRQLSDNGSLVNVTLLNPWQGVDFGTVTGGRHYIHGLFISWAQRDKQAPAIRLDRGSVTVDGCEFMDAGGRQVMLEKNAATAIILGNRFHGAARLGNKIGKRAKIMANAAI